MFFLDKLLIKWIITTCTKIGGIFMLGAFEGALIYFGTIALGIMTVIENRSKKKC